MNGREKSGPAIVAEKSTNEAERSGLEPMEPRAGTEGKAISQSAFRTLGRAAGRRVTGAGAHTASCKAQ